MSSGSERNERYRSPLKSYYKSLLRNSLGRASVIKIIEKPGKRFNYLNINTKILAILIRRTNGKTLTKYTQKKIWEPLKMEQPELWGLDDEADMEKAFCCLYSSVRDYAKLGEFFLQIGRCTGQQLLNKDFIEKMTHPELSPKYGYGTWMDYEYKLAFFAYVGLLG
ncbi:serine hydrolase domain-containing protein [Bacteroidetes bacterium endosymbiont of Geopemphigus sp.]|nr:serine hydrolase [Bacteroidetes bacterium endosymbiont of Geopemphigus sp.]